METDKQDDGIASVMETALDRALSATFKKPESPPELRAQVLAAIARDRAASWEQCRQALEDDRRQSLAALNRRYLRGCRDALLAGSVIAIAVGLAVQPMSQWLSHVFNTSAPLIAGIAALGIGLFIVAALLQDLLGRFPHEGSTR